jgi:Domain of unknown function (DUF4340)
MKITKPLIAMIVASLLFAFYVWDVDHVEKKVLTEIQNKQVMFQNPLDAIELTFSGEDGIINLKRESASTAWNITAPVKSKANDSVINAFLENLRGAKRQAQFSTDDFKKYGLDKPTRSVSVVLKRDEGQVTKTLLFGLQAMELGNVYAMIEDEKEIFTVSEWLYRQSKKNLSVLRDKKILSTSIARATSIKAETRHGEIEIKRENAGSTLWTLHTGDRAPIPADRGILDRLEMQLSSGQLLSIFDHPTSSTAELGFDDPSMRIYIDGKEELTVGTHVNQKEQFYAKTSDNKMGIISAGTVADFLRSPLEWGTKLFVWLDRDEIEVIETGSGNAMMTLMKTEKGWIFVETPGVPVRLDKMNNFLDAIRSLSALRLFRPFVSKENWNEYGILDETYRVLVESESGETQGFRFGRNDSKNGVTYVLREQDSSLWMIDFRGQGPVYKFRRDLEERRMVPGLVEKTDRIDIVMDAGTVVLQQQEATWKITLPNFPPATLPATRVTPFLKAFEGMEVESELFTKDHIKPTAVFQLYEKGQTEPYQTVGLVSRTATSAFFEADGRKVEVITRQFEPFDEEMVQLILLGKATIEQNNK